MPLALTVATAVFDEVQVNATSTMSLPMTSSALPVARSDTPRSSTSLGIVTLTLDTGPVMTVTAAAAVTAPAVARMVVLPKPMAVMRPDDVVVAIPASSLLQLTGAPAILPPDALRATASSCLVAPRMMLSTDGSTLIDVMAPAWTLTAVAANLPASTTEVAVIEAAPTATAVTSPLPVTVATSGALEDQRTAVDAVPVTFTAATMCLVWPTSSAIESGLTDTLWTELLGVVGSSPEHAAASTPTISARVTVVRVLIVKADRRLAIA
jgi:hypothetical protein